MTARVFTIVALTAIICLSGCSSIKKHGRPSTEHQSNPSGVEQKQHDEAKVKAEIQKARIVWQDEKGRPVLDAYFKEMLSSNTSNVSAVEIADVKATLYKDGEKIGYITAPKMVADSVSRSVKASGGVKMVSAENKAQCTCREMVWKSREDKIVGTGGVTVDQRGVEANASRVESDTSLLHPRMYDASISVQ